MPYIYALLFALIFLSNKTQAQNIEPYLSHDQNPLLMNFGLPLPSPAKLLTTGTSRLSTSLNVSNTINLEKNKNETLFIDAETYQLNLLFESAIQKDWMFRFQLPFVAQNKGFLDSWINNYHDFMHLPQHIRPSFPVDKFQITYVLNNESLINQQQRSSGLGDISLQLAYQIENKNNQHLSFWGSLKLPTGEAKRLTGSGSTDLALWLAGDHALKNNKWVYGNAGLMFLSKAEILPSIQKNTVLFGNAGIQLQPWEIILLKVQFDAHSQFYNSNTKFLGNVLQITFGGSILLNSSSLDIAVSEDIAPQYSPDVTFNLSWKVTL